MRVKNINSKSPFISFKDWIVLAFATYYHLLTADSSAIKINNGLMCQVLHMARCTNVPRLGHLAPLLRSRTGFLKATKTIDNR
jgi:hypothetical protein